MEAATRPKHRHQAAQDHHSYRDALVHSLDWVRDLEGVCIHDDPLREPL